MSKPSLFGPADELTPVVGQELAEAFIEMRRLLKKPLTAYGAQLMAGRLRQMPNPIASVQQSIRNSWQDCFEVREERRQPQQALRGAAALAEELRQEITNAGLGGSQGADHQTVEQLRLERQQFH